MGIDRMVRLRFAPVLLAALSALTPIRATAAEAQINILFIGNSFTHGRYEPVRTYNGGFGANDVHDLLCSTPATCSSAEQGAQVDPAKLRRPAPPWRHNSSICRPILLCSITSRVLMAG